LIESGRHAACERFAWDARKEVPFLFDVGWWAMFS
jgi:hypothetical protein